MFALGKLSIHFVQVACKQSGLVAAGAGTDLNHAAAAVRILTANGEIQQLGPKRLALGLDFRQFGLRQLAHVRVRAFRHLQRVGNLGIELAKSAIFGGQFGQRAAFAGNLRNAGGIHQNCGINQQFIELFKAA
jgi:hypothetical protein